MSATQESAAAGQRLEHPPGPRRLSWASKMKALRDVVGFAEGMQQEYGDLVRIRVGPMRLFQVTDPQLVQELLGRQYESLQKPARMQRLFRPWLGGGVLFSEGEDWRRRRRVLEGAMRFDRPPLVGRTIHPLRPSGDRLAYRAADRHCSPV